MFEYYKTAFVLYLLALAANTTAQKDSPEVVKFKAEMGDALQPCKVYLEVMSVCQVMAMGYHVIESVNCDALPELLAAIPEDRRELCTTPLQNWKMNIEAKVSAQVEAGGNKKSATALQKLSTLIPPADVQNCIQYADHFIKCNSGRNEESCEIYPKFFSQLSEPSRVSCTLFVNDKYSPLHTFTV